MSMLPKALLKRKPTTTLPAKLVDANSIENLPLNEKWYTLPWAMDVDPEGGCWLNPTYPIEKAPHGTLNLPLMRTSKGITVYPRPGHKWPKIDRLTAAHLRSRGRIPVAAIDAEWLDAE